MERTIAILVFDGAEEMDFVGPLEVLGAAAEHAGGWRVVTVAPSADAITCEKGMRVIPAQTFQTLPRADVVVIPGGGGARREVDNPETVAWLRRVADGCEWMTSVCTGAFLLVGSGIGHGKSVTTHHFFVDQLAALGVADVVRDVRFVRDGNIVSAGGVMSGIEMSLWLVEQIWGEAVRDYAKSYIAYDYPGRTSGMG